MFNNNHDSYRLSIIIIIIIINIIIMLCINSSFKYAFICFVCIWFMCVLFSVLCNFFSMFRSFYNWPSGCWLGTL